MNAVVPENTLWKKKEVLKVFFMEEQTKFTYKRATLQSWMVMKIVREGWKFDGVENGQHVPHFEQAYHATEAEIRVKFESKLAMLFSWSTIIGGASAASEATLSSCQSRFVIYVCIVRA